MSAIIEPIRDRNGHVKTNVQVVREVAKILGRMRDGEPGASAAENKELRKKYNQIIHGEPAIHSWFDMIAKIKDEEEAQRMIDETLLPVEEAGIDMTPAPRISKAERIRRAKGG